MHSFHKSFPKLFPLLSGCVFLSLTQPVMAQQVIPTQNNPGLLTPAPAEVIPQSQRPREQRQFTPTEQPPEVKIDVPEPPAAVELEINSFKADRINVEGNILVDNATIRSLVAPYEGKEVTLGDLGKLVEAINREYRKHGYLTSIAYIPPQDVNGGTITLRVLEGRVGDISVAGNKFYRAWAIARYLDEGTGDPLNIPQLEKNLRRMNRVGDYRIRATLSADNKEPGVTDIRLDVEERQPWQVGLTYDNQGRPGIGTNRWGTELTNRNVTGIGDRLYTRWIGATGTQIGMASYAVPLNRYGTELSTSFSYSHVNVDLPIPLQPLITGDAYNYGVALSQPLDREHVWSVDAGMNFRRVNSFFNRQRTDVTDVRSLAFGVNFDKFDRWGRTFARLQTTVGPQWGKQDTAQFWKAETMFNRLVRLPKKNLLILRGYSQFTPDALPPMEQFQLGGASSVRGYTEGLLIGDRGYQFSAEHRWPVPGLHHLSPWLADRIQGATFVDFGQTWLDRGNVAFIDGVSNRKNRTLLLGAGIGVRARLTQYMQGFVDCGFGLVDRGNIEPNAQPTARVAFGIRSDLLPEDYRAWSKKETTVKVKARNTRYAKARAAAVTQAPDATDSGKAPASAPPPPSSK
jgi:hemolysin activation/secretion protein